MLEYPEVITLSAQLEASVVGQRVVRVLPQTKPHKFCWFNGDPAAYDAKLAGSAVKGALGFGIFAELHFDNGLFLCVNDGVNARLVSRAKRPKQYQLLIELSDGRDLVFTVAMYGSIILHAGDYENEYYKKSQAAIGPFESGFRAHYEAVLSQCPKKLTAKGLLATNQRFPGIGNGVLQDVLFAAGIHPKRAISTMSSAELDKLFDCTVSVLREMTDAGGRDTEKDLFGSNGGYRTLMSKNTVGTPCKKCGAEIKKETYMGGSVYYCPGCQPL